MLVKGLKQVKGHFMYYAFFLQYLIFFHMSWSRLSKIVYLHITFSESYLWDYTMLNIIKYHICNYILYICPTIFLSKKNWYCTLAIIHAECPFCGKQSHDLLFGTFLCHINLWLCTIFPFMNTSIICP